jgi:hypothetical protein
MNPEEHQNDAANQDQKDDGHGREHRHEPKPEPPGRVIHPRPSHGDSGTR